MEEQAVVPSETPLVVAVRHLACFLAWMKTAILAGGIAVIRSGVDYVEGGDEV